MVYVTKNRKRLYNVSVETNGALTYHGLSLPRWYAVQLATDLVSMFDGSTLKIEE